MEIRWASSLNLSQGSPPHLDEVSGPRILFLYWGIEGLEAKAQLIWLARKMPYKRVLIGQGVKVG
jgi:hypothetical protein